ncbi:hypothetical protein G7Z17_g3016 [Cylindrodendrum hubeiense]|uniref:Uncharacterized protein n=1 Tax=Cylindrodendrum hubeiense TaxID=595255 RepID=A0A9P5HFH8_9HYPO|nr:hypothetical protein G7Z17_g3016 [Cylindrodendrum hubeiense]
MADPNVFPEVVSFTQKWHTEPYSLISSERAELSVSDKNVVVTGGGTGIGKAIAVAFAKAGANSVAILGRRVDRLQSGVAAISAANVGTSALYEIADLTSSIQVENALDRIVSKTGKIDIFVSSAGTLSELGPIVGYDSSTFMRSFELNTLTTFNVIQAFTSHCGADPVFINVSTCTAHTRPIYGAGAYNISKLASLKTVDQFAFENEKFHVVQFHPGWVPTEMNGMQAEAPDVAELPGMFCVWLASPEARFLRGKFVWSNWDVQELLQRADEIKSSKLLNLVLDGVLM